MSEIPDLAALPQPLVLAAHDAGAANIIFGWLKAFPDLSVRAAMEGPARTIWERTFPDRPLTPLDAALDGAAQMLSGTGWASRFEHEARQQARRSGIPAIAVVDHWVNYRQRFVRNGDELLPDEIWVSDRYALDIASDEFPDIPVRAFANRYLDAEVEAVRGLDAADPMPAGHRILYALEPVRLAWRGDDLRPGEFQALDYFVSRLDALDIPADAEIRLRPHPSDPPGKYEAWVAANTHLNVSMAPDEPIADAVHWAGWIAGCESFVLIIGVAAGRRVVSTLPPWGNALRLPHEAILRLRDL
jgi:hypothetical protein